MKKNLLMIVVIVSIAACAISLNDPKTCFQHNICDWIHEGQADREKQVDAGPIKDME